MLDIAMIALILVLALSMLGLLGWAGKSIDKGSADK